MTTGNQREKDLDSGVSEPDGSQGISIGRFLCVLEGCFLLIFVFVVGFILAPKSFTI
jgi:hypothetical protein